MLSRSLYASFTLAPSPSSSASVAPVILISVNKPPLPSFLITFSPSLILTLTSVPAALDVTLIEPSAFEMVIAFALFSSLLKAALIVSVDAISPVAEASFL